MTWLLAGIRRSLRSIWRSRTHSAFFVLVMGPIIALTTIIVSIQYATNARFAEFRDPASVAVVMASTDRQCDTLCPDWLDRASLEHIARDVVGPEFIPFRMRSFNWRNGDGHGTFSGTATSSRITALHTSPVHAGRPLLPADDIAGAPRVALLSETAWRRHFARSSDVIGQRLDLDGEQYQIVGVLRAGAEYPMGTDLLTNGIEADRHSGTGFFGGLVRVTEPGAFAALRTRLRVLADELWPATQPTDERPGLIAIPLASHLETGNSDLVRTAITINLAILALLALTLQLIGIGRTLGRAGEFAILAALGASRSQLRTVALLEQAVLGAIASGFGIVAGLISLRIVGPLLQHRLGLAVELRPDWSAIGATFLIGCTIAVAGAIGGILTLRESNLQAGGSDGSVGTVAGGGRNLLRTGLIVAQLAVTVVLVATAATPARSLTRVRHADLGFETKDLVAASLMPRNAGQMSDADRYAAADAIARGIAGVAGVRTPTVWRTASPSVMAERGEPWVTIAGVERRLIANCRHPTDCTAPLNATGVLPGFVNAIGLRVIDGRDITDADRRGTEPVALVTEQTARAWWPGENPIGRRFKIGSLTSPYPWLTVVGVVANTHPVNQEAYRYAAMYPGEFYPSFFQPLSQFVDRTPHQIPWTGALTVAMRTDRLDGRARGALVTAIESAAPGFRVEAIQRFDDMALDTWGMVRLRFNLRAMQWVAMLGLVLSLASIASAVNEVVLARYREMGIRLALGAIPRRLVGWLVLRTTMIGVLAGVIGISLTLGLSRLLSSALFGARNHLLFGGEAFGAVLLITTAAMLAGAVAGSAYLVARPIGRINPIEALRNER